MTATTTAFDSTLKNLGITRTADKAGPNVQTASEANQLTQKDFLTLLTAQLRNQDPTAPQDPMQQITQLAQFTQVSGIAEMNKTLKTVADRLNGTSTSDAMSYVGRAVLTEGNSAFANSDGSVDGAVELAADAASVRVAIQAPNGELMKVVDLGAQKKGSVDWKWDGKTAAGDPAPAGPYKISVTASNNGKSVGTTGLVWAPVESVSLPAGGAPKLNLVGLGQIDPSQVRKAS